MTSSTKVCVLGTLDVHCPLAWGMECKNWHDLPACDLLQSFVLRSSSQLSADRGGHVTAPSLSIRWPRSEDSIPSSFGIRGDVADSLASRNFILDIVQRGTLGIWMFGFFIFSVCRLSQFFPIFQIFSQIFSLEFFYHNDHNQATITKNKLEQRCKRGFRMKSIKSGKKAP